MFQSERERKRKKDKVREKGSKIENKNQERTDREILFFMRE